MHVTPSTGGQYRPPQVWVSLSAGVVQVTTSEGGPSADDPQCQWPLVQVNPRTLQAHSMEIGFIHWKDKDDQI